MTPEPQNSGPPTPPLATLTLFGYSGAARVWAFTQMGLAWPHLARAEGLRFFKLLGSGHGSGFSLRPNFSRYGLLASWDSEDSAETFLRDSPLMASYRRHADEIWTVRLLPIKATGTWSGTNPFLPVASDAPAGPVAVLTRASIRLARLRAFWSAVPATSRALDEADGLLASIGIGESPFVRQATFSIWRDGECMREFAYRNVAHRDTIRRTRDEGWYGEDLFARFVPLASEGTWHGRDPLGGLL